jgi:IclR family transcriptional regulator, acetate operon repressor
MNGKSTHDTPTIQSLDRGLAILEAVAASSEPVPLKQLTDLIGIDRSSVFRLANTLRQRRFLSNPQGSKDYILGPSAWRLSRKYGRHILGTFFHQYLRDLTAKLGETSHFAVREGGQAFFIDHHTPTGQMVSVAGQTGEFAPLHCTAHGKALLADFDLEGLTALLGRSPLRGYTRSTIVSLSKLARVCREVRAAGVALDDGEYIEEVRCIAAPIRDPQGEVVASVGISAPVTRLHQRRISRATADVRAAGRAISAALAG